MEVEGKEEGDGGGIGGEFVVEGAKWDKMAAPVTKRANNNEQRRVHGWA